MTLRPPFPLLAAAALTLVSGLAQADTGKLLLTGKDSAAARQLLAFLKSDRAVRIIQSFGYGIH